MRTKIVAVIVAALTSTPGVAMADEAPPFHATIAPISPAVEQEMVGVSWHEGCPVPISDLRMISMNYWGFDGQSHEGELVVNKAAAQPAVDAFRDLYNWRFPIRRMERVDAYGGSDDASMAADNTSAFNCRAITGGTSFSQHAYGYAIDINTIENPYVSGDTVEPPAGEAYLDRSDERPGMLINGSDEVRAFQNRGFTWGGHWKHPIDYQHFQYKKG